MLKLYRKSANKFEYWETWDKDKETGIVHWGVVGEKGESKEIKSKLLEPFRKKIQQEIAAKQREGFEPIDIDDHAVLLIEYVVDGVGSPSDLEKRTRLQDRMDDTLGWVGLGHCDGGSIGSGTMEVCCYVVDFDIAKKVIQDDLKNSEFADYIRIYDENEA